MALHNLTAIRVREPGFSPSECLELARKIENDELFTFEGELDLSHTEEALIVAALRAYAE